jgi:recombination protein RecA
MGVEAGFVKKSGSWFNYGDERLGQGREAAKRTLKENPDIRNEIETKVRAEYGLPPVGDAAAAKTDEEAKA